MLIGDCVVSVVVVRVEVLWGMLLLGRLGEGDVVGRIFCDVVDLIDVL